MFHPGISGNTVVVVDDVVARLQIFKSALRTLCRSNRSMSSSPTGYVSLSQHRQRKTRRDETVLDRRGHDMAAGLGHMQPSFMYLEFDIF
jgi:hypothetical protein